MTPSPATLGRPVRVAYVMSRFPRLTETFVVGEILAVRRAGADVVIYPLLRERADVVHPDAAALAAEARYQPFVSLPIVASQLHWLRRRPRAYLSALSSLVRHAWGSANFVLGGVGMFPKVAHMARLMVDEGVEHVHCHFANHPAAAGFIIHRLTGIPYSFTAHGSDLHVDRHMLRAKVDEAAFAVTVSEFNRRVMVETCGEAVADGKVTVLRCGVDADLFAPRPEAAGADGRFDVVCIGTLHEVKGQRHLVEACRLAVADGVDLACTLIGDGPDRADLEADIAAAGLGDRVTLTGRLPREEVARRLAGADVLVAPSVPTRKGKREGMPTVLIEAMASGVAVVASRLAGIPELVEDGVTGRLAEPGDPRGIADALEALAGDDAHRRQLAEAGRARVLAEYDRDASARALVEHFARSARPQVEAA